MMNPLKVIRCAAAMTAFSVVAAGAGTSRGAAGQSLR